MQDPGAGNEPNPPALLTRVNDADNPRFSLCCLVTDWDDYRQCRSSFVLGGFTDADCEYLIIDNSTGNRADAFEGLNVFLQEARAPFVLLHHQDVRLLDDGAEQLQGKLDHLTDLDPTWAVCGNAGVRQSGRMALFLSHPHQVVHTTGGPFPARVGSLDENFMVVRRKANLALSRDLQGFHHYAADLCIVADILGWHIYVIDFFLRHNSPGNPHGSYISSHRLFTRKYARALRSRRLELVTGRAAFLSPWWVYRSAGPAVRKAAKATGLLDRRRAGAAE